MNDAAPDLKATGRLIGILVLAQIAGGATVNAALLGPVIKGGFLAAAAPNATQVSVSVVLALLTAAVSLAIAISAYPVFRRCSQAVALWLFALAIANFTLAAVEQMSVMSMLSLSQAYVAAGSPDGEMFQALRAVVGSARNWAHYVNISVASGSLLVFYGALLRYAYVPRLLAAFGLFGVLLQLTTVTLPIFGQKANLMLLAPLGLAHLSLGLWLVVRGFAEPRGAR